VTQTPAALQPVQQAALEIAVLDAFAPASRHDPYPAYEVLRAAGPFVPGPLDTQLVTRYADCEAVLRDPRWSSNPAHRVPTDGWATNAREEIAQGDSHVLLFIDPPDHTRIRNLVSRNFTPKAIAEWRPRLVEIVDALLDEAAASGEIELIADFADSGDETFSVSRERFFLAGDDNLWIAIMEGDPLPSRSYNHIAFRIADSDYDACLSRVRGLGLEVRETRPRVAGEGRSIYFYDDDNHLFELHTGTLAERLSRYERGRNG